MNYSELISKPLWQLTAEEFLFLSNNASPVETSKKSNEVLDTTSRKYVYGLAGLANLLGCSKGTAGRIKKSGKLAPAIKQFGRKIIIDADLAIELFGRKSGGRK